MTLLIVVLALFLSLPRLRQHVCHFSVVRTSVIDEYT